MVNQYIVVVSFLRPIHMVKHRLVGIAHHWAKYVVRVALLSMY